MKIIADLGHKMGAKRDAKGSRFGGLAKCENCARRELNFDPHEVSQRASRNDGLPRPSRRLPGGLKDFWRSLERPEDTVGPGAAGYIKMKIYKFP